jgi:hypothetical protein
MTAGKRGRPEEEEDAPAEDEEDQEEGGSGREEGTETVEQLVRPLSSCTCKPASWSRSEEIKELVDSKSDVRLNTGLSYPTLMVNTCIVLRP